MFHLTLISGYRLVSSVYSHQLYRKVFSFLLVLWLISCIWWVCWEFVFVVGKFIWAEVCQAHIDKSYCVVSYEKSRLLNFFYCMSCVCLWFLFVGYWNQVYTVRILELWFATLITYGNHLGNFQKFAGAWVPPFKDWFDRTGVWPGPQFPQWISCEFKVENLCSRDSYWTYSIRMCDNLCFVFLSTWKFLS